MAETIKGINVVIGSDTQGLQAALSAVDKKSRDIQSELKQVEKLLKLDPKNTELLAQKQKLLTEAVKNTSDKLNSLKEAQKQVNDQFAKGEITEGQYRAFQREIVKTEEELKKLGGQLGKVNDKWEESADKLGKFGNRAKDLGNKLAPVSVVASAVGAGMVGLAVKAGQTADDLNTLSKQTGLATDTLQKFRLATDIIDVPMETLTGSLTKLTRSMGEAKNGSKGAEEAFAKLRVEYKDKLTGELRDSEDVFNEVITALGKVGNEAERDVLSMELFGKSAQDLNPLILGGADALKQIGEEAEKTGKILSQEALDSINEFNDEIDLLKADAGATMLQLGVTIGEALLPVLKTLAEGLKDVMEWARGLDKGTLALILTMVAMVAALAPVLIILGTMAGAVSNLIKLHGLYVTWLGTSTLATKIWTTVTTIAATAGKAFAGVLAFITGPAAAVIAIIAALVAAGIILYENWDTITKFAEKMWQGLKNIFSKIGDFIMGIWSGIVQGIKDKINTVLKFINNMINALNSLKIKLPNFMGGKDIGFNIKNIPLLANGGNVIKEGFAIVGEEGPELLKLPQAAEVSPLNKGGLGPVNVYVNADDLQQVTDVVRLFSRLNQVARQGV